MPVGGRGQTSVCEQNLVVVPPDLALAEPPLARAPGPLEEASWVDDVVSAGHCCWRRGGALSHRPR